MKSLPVFTGAFTSICIFLILHPFAIDISLEALIVSIIVNLLIGGVLAGYLSPKFGWLNGAMTALLTLGLSMIFLLNSYFGIYLIERYLFLFYLPSKIAGLNPSRIDIYDFIKGVIAILLVGCVSGVLGGYFGERYRLYRQAKKEK